jgi:hypothetical protein
LRLCVFAGTVFKGDTRMCSRKDAKTQSGEPQLINVRGGSDADRFFACKMHIR